MSKYFETSTGKSSSNKIALLYLGNKELKLGDKDNRHFEDNLLLYIKEMEENQRNEKMGGAAKQIIKKKVLSKKKVVEEDD